MAEKKFNKGTEEWMMFVDFWNICQKNWLVENSDSYWANIIADAHEFHDKYKDIPLAKNMILSFVKTQEELAKNK